MRILSFLLLFTCLSLSAQELVTIPAKSGGHVDIRFMFYSGSVDDPADQLGLTYLTAQNIVEGGTASMTKEQIDGLLFPYATSIDADIDKQAISFSATIHVDQLDKIYPVMRDLLLKPRFEERDFKRVKEDALKSVTQSIPDNNDEVLSKRVLDALMYKGHPYGHLVQGTESSLKKITLADVKAHAAKVFTKTRLHIGVAGKYPPGFAEQVKKDMGALPTGKPPIKIEDVPMPNGIEAMVVSKQRAFGSAIFMGFPLKVDRSSDDFAAMLVLNSYFGEHRNSYGRLYQQMRGKRSLNYGDYSYMEWYPSGHRRSLPMPGYPRGINAFQMWIRPVQIAEQFAGIEGLEQPELGNGVHSIRQSLRELRKLVEQGISEKDFQITRTFMKGYLRHYVQSQYDRLGFLMDGRYYGREDYIEEMIDLMDKLTVDDVNKAIKRYLHVDQMYLAVITDDSEAEKLAKALKDNSSAPIVYKPVVRAGLDKEILDEDKEIDAYKLPVSKVTIVPKEKLFR